MVVLGFSNGHDKGAVIIEDGKIKVGITQERITRKKHDGGYSGGLIPFESINYCLNYLSYTFDDIDLVVYSTTELSDTVPEQITCHVKNFDLNKLKFIPHHLAHAYSSFFSSGFDEAVVIVCDASGSILNDLNYLHEWYPDVSKSALPPNVDLTEAISIYKFTKSETEEIYKKWIKYPIPINTTDEFSLGMLYGQGCRQIVYDKDTNSWTAGKLMGLASYADQNIVDEYPPYIQDLGHDIFIPNTPIKPEVNWEADFFSRACVAGIYQREQERGSLILARIAKELSNSPNLCVAGGSFLNCNANQAILDSDLYEDCYFIPPSDDSGIPLGCAWFAYQNVAQIQSNKILLPYLGKKYNRKEIISTLNEFPFLTFREFEVFDDITEQIATELSKNKVVGWFQGGSEVGPRALGNRSILASPINSWMTKHINSDIKMREWYRPFAPAVLYENQNEIFESDVFSPYMLTVTNVKESWRLRIPAVTHFDNSARVQSVTIRTNEKFYKLIRAFKEKTSVPVLLNTSFNGPHEPIVETPKNAILTFLSQNIDILVIENFIITR